MITYVFIYFYIYIYIYPLIENLKSSLIYRSPKFQLHCIYRVSFSHLYFHSLGFGSQNLSNVPLQQLPNWCPCHPYIPCSDWYRSCWDRKLIMVLFCSQKANGSWLPKDKIQTPCRTPNPFQNLCKLCLHPRYPTLPPLEPNPISVCHINQPWHMLATLSAWERRGWPVISECSPCTKPSCYSFLLQ